MLLAPWMSAEWMSEPVLYEGSVMDNRLVKEACHAWLSAAHRNLHLASASISVWEIFWPRWTSSSGLHSWTVLRDGADGRVNESAAHFIQIGEASHGTLDSQTSGKRNTVAPQSRGRSRIHFLKFKMWPAEHQPGIERRHMVHSWELLPHSSVLRMDLEQEAGHRPPPPRHRTLWTRMFLLLDQKLHEGRPYFISLTARHQAERWATSRCSRKVSWTNGERMLFFLHWALLWWGHGGPFSKFKSPRLGLEWRLLPPF